MLGIGGGGGGCVYTHARTKGSRASVADGKINISTVPFFHVGSRQNFYIWRGEKKGGGCVFFYWGEEEEEEVVLRWVVARV